MAEQLNDVMDASVSALNKTTEESRLAGLGLLLVYSRSVVTMPERSSGI